MNRTVLRGLAAQVKWGYRVAASLGPWELAMESHGGTLTAAVVSSDACAVSQRPLIFEVSRPKGQRWVWPIESLQIKDGRLTASVGPLQE
jgi:hypothetical protein